MAKVIIKAHKASLLNLLKPTLDVICADCKVVLLEDVPSIQATHYRAGEFVEHRCEVKVLAA
jgi:hypothetical protein